MKDRNGGLRLRLDLQGITEALSYYYETHNHSFDELFIPAEFKKSFKQLAQDAKEYYCC